VSSPQQNPRAWPRWPTLSLLIAGVLGAHLALLADGLPSWLSQTRQTPQAAPPPATQKATAVLTRNLAPEAAQPRPPAVQTSQVRWIAPPAPEPAAPKPIRPVETAVRPKPAPVAAPAVAPTESAIVAAAAAPEPKRLSEPSPAEPDRAAVLPQDTVATLAASSESAPEPAQETPPIASNDSELAEASVQNTGTSTAPEAEGISSGPAQLPASAQLSYSVEGQSKGLNYNASGALDWRNDGQGYSARMEIRMFLLGSRVQTSQGGLNATGLQPERFADKSRSERAAHFDRKDNRIRFSNNAPDAELLPGAQDRLSVFMQLAGLLNARPEAYPAGQVIALPVAGVGGSEVWRFQVQGLASLDLPAGSLIARHLVREPREARDTRVEIWLAPSLGHLPVRIRLTQDSGDVVDQRLSTLP
jgi:outer membrane biosynthesis protein TonB